MKLYVIGFNCNISRVVTAFNLLDIAWKIERVKMTMFNEIGTYL